MLAQTTRRRALAEGLVLLLCLVLGAALRFYQLEGTPPGLYTDEAFYALDALEVLAGARPIYFPANNGREPLFIYVLSVSLAALGRTPLAVRLPAALFGVLHILAVYLAGRTLFNRRVALLAAAVAAGTFWAVALSRIGLRAATLPAVGALLLAALAYAWRGRRPWALALAGVLLGLSLYTYLAARLIPAVLLAVGIFWYSAERLHGRRPALPWRDLAWFLAPALLVSAPLLIYAWQAPQVYLGRVEQVSIFQAGLGPGLSTLWANAGAVLGAFTIAGDWNARHNLPGRPVFDLGLGAAFWLGAGWCAWRAGRRGDARAALLIVWAGGLLAPTLLSQEAPHFLRAIGALPVVCLLPALGLDLAADWMARRWPARRWIALMAAAALVIANSARTARDYFGPYARAPQTAYAFQSAALDLARSATAYLDAGAGRVFVDQRLWDGFPSLWFLLTPGPGWQLFAPDAVPMAGPSAARYYVWPHSGGPAALPPWLAPAAQVEAVAGPDYRNEWEADAYPLYVQYTVRPVVAAAAPPLAVFERGIILRAADVVSETAGLRVVLTWSADPPPGADWKVFVHLRAGPDLLDQADADLGGLWYPAAAWRAGDWVTQTAWLAAPPGEGEAEIVVGLYHYPEGERLRVIGAGQDQVRLDWRGQP